MGRSGTMRHLVFVQRLIKKPGRVFFSSEGGGKGYVYVSCSQMYFENFLLAAGGKISAWRDPLESSC